MSGWELAFLDEALNDMKALDGAVRRRVVKAIEKVRTNPLPKSEGGYGNPLGNQHGYNLTGLLKIKLRADGIRIVYKLIRQDDLMLVVIVGARSDDEVYREAAVRRKYKDL